MDSSSWRYIVVKWLIILAAVSICVRLFTLQIVDSSLKQRADRNTLRYNVQYPPRGEILDRNGHYLARSREAYDIMIIPKDVSEFDTGAMARLLGVDTLELVRAVERARRYSMRQPSVLFKEMPKEVKLQLDERSVSGFYTQYRSARSYPTQMAGNLLGYVGKVGQWMIDADPYYTQDDNAGMSGIEQAYEKELRGVKGVNVQMVDVFGVPQGSYMNGAEDVLPVAGKSIVTTIDGELQELAEKLLKGKVGSVVAIEPSTGEILVMASSPSYDPDLLVGRERGNNYMDMIGDKRRPLFNRAVMASYPPGSTFKVVNGLIAMQLGIAKASDRYSCYGRYPVGRGVGCHSHTPSLDMAGATQHSCNTYFCYVFRDLLDKGASSDMKENFQTWVDAVGTFGFGRKLGSDFRNELSGTLRGVDYYNRVYRGWWNSLTVISLSIGQGELGVTPLQMANLAAIVANRGHYHIPHVVKAIEGVDTIDHRFKEELTTMVDREHFDPIVEGMYRAVHEEGGTARIANVPGLSICGKTGTAQNPQGADHSTFMSFAPRDNPKIAVSVYIEHGRFGATSAAPIASLLIEQYLTDTITRPQLVDYVTNLKINYPMYQNK